MKRLLRPLALDDSGISALVGDALIGAYNGETGEYAFRRIPVHYFQETYFSRVECYRLITETTLQLALMNALPGQPIQICRGNCFLPAARELIRLGFIVRRMVIGEPLQSKLHDEHVKLLGELSMPVSRRCGGQAALEAHDAALWVGEDLPGRVKLVKTRYRAWRQEYKALAEQRFAGGGAA